jgi:hypothetical protein
MKSSNRGTLSSKIDVGDVVRLRIGTNRRLSKHKHLHWVVINIARSSVDFREDIVFVLLSEASQKFAIEPRWKLIKVGKKCLI